MPNTKISALTAGNPAQSTDAIPIARGAANFQLTAASVANLYSRTTVTAASATPVTLTVTSPFNNIVTGSGGQVIQLPDATTLTVGTAFQFNNNQSSGAITVNNNSGTLIVSVPSGGLVVVTLLTNGTAAGTWDRHDLSPSNVAWSTNTFDYPGSITSATWNGVTVATNRGGTGLASFTSGGAVYATSTSALTTGVLPTASGGTNLTSFTSGGAVYATSTSALTTGTLPLASGGTGQTTKAAAFNALSPVTTTGDLIIGNGSNSNTRLGIGTNGYVLTSNGSTASWQAVSITGPVAISDGGTGQVTKAQGFDALSPLTDVGDLITYSGANNIRLPTGTAGYILTANGPGATPYWNTPPVFSGVTSFDAGSTGLSPSGTNTGAITLSGTLNTGNGGTGTTTSPSNGQLLIGNGSGYSVANLTAGANVTITNSSGGITIAASGGGGGPTISVLNVSTVSSGGFYNDAPSSTRSAPLIGSATSPSNYGAFFFKSTFSGSLIYSASLTFLGITDSTSTFTSYSSPMDFTSSPFAFYVYDDIVSCYGLSVYNAALQTIFSDSAAAITSPSLAPLDASSAYSSTNPAIYLSTSDYGSFNNNSGVAGIVVSKSGSTYILEFGSNTTGTTVYPTVTSMYFSINNSFTSTFTNFIDFNVSYAENTTNGKFRVEMLVSNATMQTLLDNSFLS